MTRAPEGFFLQQLFNSLNAAGIRYAVMRNHLPLPVSTGGSDLDLIVDEADESQTKILIENIIREAGGSLLGSIYTYGFYKVCIIGNNVVNGDWWGVCIDINFGLFFKGQRLMAVDAAWPVNYYRGIPVLTDDFAAVLGVLKEVLNNGTVPPKYIDRAKNAALSIWRQVGELLAPMGGGALLHLKELLQSEDYTTSRESKCDLVRSEFMRHSLCVSTYRFFVGRAGYEWSKAARYFNPSGKVVAILGVDGAGKSTIINAIKPVLNSATHNSVVVQHLRPTLLPPLSRLKGKPTTEVGPVVNPHGKKPSGITGSLFRLVYLTFDYVFGYWFKIRPKIAKQPTLVIFDRYAYDLIIDPIRFRIKLPITFIRAITWIAPKPDFVICLYGNPKVLQMRKSELSFDEVQRQVMALKKFASTMSNAYLVSSERSVSETSSEILKILLNKYRD